VGVLRGGFFRDGLGSGVDQIGGSVRSSPGRVAPIRGERGDGVGAEAATAAGYECILVISRCAIATVVR
jgi:hypothetical protein